MDFLPQWASDLSGWGVVAVFVFLIATGRLVPRRAVEDANARADKFQQAWEVLLRARREEDQVRSDVTMEVGQITAKVMETIQAEAQKKRAVDPDGAS